MTLFTPLTLLPSFHGNEQITECIVCDLERKKKLYYHILSSQLKTQLFRDTQRLNITKYLERENIMKLSLVRFLY